MKKQSWQGLANRLEGTLDEIGIRLPNSDRHLFGDLEMLDARCQDLPRRIEVLAAQPNNEEEWEALGSDVGRLLAEAKLLRWEASRIQAPLQRLLGLICAVGKPRKRSIGSRRGGRA